MKRTLPILTLLFFALGAVSVLWTLFGARSGAEIEFAPAGLGTLKIKTSDAGSVSGPASRIVAVPAGNPSAGPEANHETEIIERTVSFWSPDAQVDFADARNIVFRPEGVKIDKIFPLVVTGLPAGTHLVRAWLHEVQPTEIQNSPRDFFVDPPQVISNNTIEIHYGGTAKTSWGRHFQVRGTYQRN